MSALSGDFYGFDDLFPQEFFQNRNTQRRGYRGDLITFKVMDTILIVPDESTNSVMLVLHEGATSPQPGAGSYLTVGQAIRVIALLRDCIAYIEHGGVAPGALPGGGGGGEEEEDGQQGEGGGREKHD